jgi:SAM-dependent methyltransferase
MTQTPHAPVHWPGFLRELNASEYGWSQHVVKYSRADAVPWMPYAIPSFVSMLTEAVMVAPPDARSEIPGPARFLDVGCGPGTKMRLAAAMFGLDAWGIDIVPAFISEARAHGCQALLRDAFEYDGYDNHEIVLVNRPSTLMDDLEFQVMDQMAPGAVLIAVNWRNTPGKNGWTLISQEWGEPVRGVWVKS